MTKERLHRNADPDDPVYILYSNIIKEINLHIRSWKETEGLSKYQVDQAIASALLSEAAHYFGNVWGVNKDIFCQMAEEEYDNHCSPDAFGGVM